MLSEHSAGPHESSTLQFGAPSVRSTTEVSSPSPRSMGASACSVGAVGVPPSGTALPRRSISVRSSGPSSLAAAYEGGSPSRVENTSSPGSQPVLVRHGGKTAAPYRKRCPSDDKSSAIVARDARYLLRMDPGSSSDMLPERSTMKYRVGALFTSRRNSSPQNPASSFTPVSITLASGGGSLGPS